MQHDDPMFLPYVAGFFDGEGSLGIYGTSDGQTRMNLVVSVTNTNLNVIEQFVHRWGGTVQISAPANTRGKNRTTYRWRCASAKAMAFLEDIAPYLLIKKPQVDLAREFQTFVLNNRQTRMHAPRQHRGSLPLSSEEIELRRVYADRMKILKKETFGMMENGLSD